MSLPFVAPLVDCPIGYERRNGHLEAQLHLPHHAIRLCGEMKYTHHGQQKYSDARWADGRDEQIGDEL